MGSIARTVMGIIKLRLVRRLMPEPKMSCFYSSGTYFGRLSRLAKLTASLVAIFSVNCLTTI